MTKDEVFNLKSDFDKAREPGEELQLVEKVLQKEMADKRKAMLPGHKKNLYAKSISGQERKSRKARSEQMQAWYKIAFEKRANMPCDAVCLKNNFETYLVKMNLKRKRKKLP